MRILNIKGNWHWYLALPTHNYTVATYKAHKICMLYFSHCVLYSGWSYKYFCDFTIFVASGTHLTMTEHLSIAFFGYHISHIGIKVPFYTEKLNTLQEHCY